MGPLINGGPKGPPPSEDVVRGETDPIIGHSGPDRVRLSELSDRQMLRLFRIIYKKDPIVKARPILARAIQSALERGEKLDYELPSYIVCERDKARPHRISRGICRSRQMCGLCNRAGCDEKIVQSRKEKKKMTAKDETQQTTPVEKKVAKADLLRSAFDEKNEWTMDELLDRTGYDEANLKTSFGILKNVKRTKPENMLFVEYDKETKTYTRIDPPQAQD